VNPSASIVNPAEKYIQVISVDNHEFWFMGFLNYDGAVTSLQDSLQAGALRSVWYITGWLMTIKACWSPPLLA